MMTTDSAQFEYGVVKYGRRHNNLILSEMIFWYQTRVFASYLDLNKQRKRNDCFVFGQNIIVLSDNKF